MWVFRRSFATTTTVFARRRPVVALDGSGSGGFGFGSDGVSGLTGKWAVDGLHRFELDLLETAAWTKGLLADMSSSSVSPSESSSPSSSSPSSSVTGLALEQEHHFTYLLDNGNNGKATAAKLHVDCARIAPLLNNSAPAIHKFSVLAAPFFNKSENSWIFSSSSSSSSTSSVEEKLQLLKTLNALLQEALNDPTALSTTPIDLRHVKKPKRDLSFPEAWKKSPLSTAPSSSSTSPSL
ncbi:UNVERIFIED_CONTAM: hypothetical protein HDU68_003768 [Siphonaria sp. JEL0065]|nr:hypothetical protein HDU68_003768 [Siphonaria sp. JEL0065]